MKADSCIQRTIRIYVLLEKDISSFDIYVYPPMSQWVLEYPTKPDDRIAVRQLGNPVWKLKFIFWSPAQRESAYFGDL